MFVESLELDNFKSFGKRTEIVFRKGFTVISGPNGSGKSNIGDSLLFVLGERSNKTVRADRLADLIHKGKDGEKHRNGCSVAIRIDTEDKSVAEKDRKLEIKRELQADHDGIKSVYYLNGVKVRYSDISNAMDSLRIFLDSYSFVLQGDINNIVKMSGGERRKLLESISGIESFDIQIDKAQTDIELLNSNLGKMEVLRDQLTIRRTELEAEREVAQKYLELSRKMRNLKVTELDITLGSLRREISSQTSQISNFEQEISSLNDENEKGLQKIQEIKSEISDLQGELDRTGNSELNSIRTQIQDLRVEIASNQMKTSDLMDNLASDRSEIETNIKYVESSGNKIQWIMSNITESRTILKDLETKLKEKQEKLRVMREASTKNSINLLEMQEKIRELDSAIQNLNAQLEEINSKQSFLSQDRSRINSEIASLEEKAGELEFQIKDYSWAIQEAKDSEARKSDNFEELNRTYYQLKNQLTEKRNRKDLLQKEVSRTNSEFSQVQIALGSRGTIQNRALTLILDARNRREIEGIIGPVKELIKFDSKFRNSIEAAAGSRLNAVAVRDDGVAEECLNILKSAKAGKLTFLPVNKMIGGRPRGKAITVRGSEGSLGYVLENIQYDPAYENLMWYSFQDTVIVDSVKTARRYMGGIRMVTIEGDIFEASGAISGGYIERGKNSADLEEKSALLSDSLKKLNDELALLETEIKEISARFEDIASELQTRSSDQGSNRTKLQMLEQNLSRSREQLVLLSPKLSEKRMELQRVEDSLSETLKAADLIKVRIQDTQQSKENVFAEMRKVSPAYVSQDEDLSSEIESIKEKENAYRVEISKLESEAGFITENVENAKRKNESIQAEIEMMQNQISGLKDRKEELKSQLEKLQMLETQIDEQTRSIVERIRGIEKTSSSLNEELETRKSMITTKREMIITLQGKRENSQSRLKDTETELTTLEGERIPDIHSVQEARAAFIQTQKDIEALGMVNQKAIEEYNSVSKDLDSIANEIEQLTEEKMGLLELTAKLNDQKKIAFMETFNGINSFMRKIYFELSGGGDAYLELSDEGNPLVAEVSIRARPKGFNFTKIEALSGGEKSLTALAFILSVQRTNPSPVYYLDEVDMFLDGANAERVGKLFRSNSTTSQIFSVSLRKSMLKYADHVVGVINRDGENSEVYEKSFTILNATEGEGEKGRDT